MTYQMIIKELKRTTLRSKTIRQSVSNNNIPSHIALPIMEKSFTRSTNRRQSIGEHLMLFLTILSTVFFLITSFFIYIAEVTYANNPLVQLKGWVVPVWLISICYLVSLCF